VEKLLEDAQMKLSAPVIRRPARLALRPRRAGVRHGAQQAVRR
jgi:hypothetical protein